MPIQGFTNGTLLLFGGGESSGDFLPVTPIPPDAGDQPASEKLVGFPQVYALRAEYVGQLTEDMGDAVDELLQ